MDSKDLAAMAATIEQHGPSRDLDQDAARALGWRAESFGEMALHGNRTPWCWRNPRRDTSWTQQSETCPPCYTESLDEVIAEIDPKRFMWFLGNRDPTDMRFAATISHIGHVGVPTWRGTSESPACALLAALLRAMGAVVGESLRDRVEQAIEAHIGGLNSIAGVGGPHEAILAAAYRKRLSAAADAVCAIINQGDSK